MTYPGPTGKTYITLAKEERTMKMDDLQDLFHDELKDTYDAEQQILKALPKMSKAATSPKLKAAFDKHLKQTEEHITRLEQVFEIIGKKPSRKPCKGMQGLIEEGQEMIKEKPDPEVLDAALIAAAQRVEHYEMAAYGCLRTYAGHLDMADAKKLLQTTLDEEGATDELLTKLAETDINLKAVA
jgi:ferritin-like metal-binding protein YciE